MPDLLVAAPLTVERLAVRLGLPASAGRVVRTGMGPRRTGRRRSLVAGEGPLAVMGVAGALAGDLHPGDLVVASEVRRADEPNAPVVTCPSAPLLAGALRRAGLRVHVGPVVTSDRIVRGPDRAALAATGALAVDMESADLIAPWPRRPIAVVRAIVDTPDSPLLRISTLRHGVKALRSLRRAAAVVGDWAAAASARGVVLAAPRSFCAGVDRAIDIVRRAVERFGAPVYVRRQLVHNAHVVADLQSHGVVFVEELDEVPLGARVVLAAHGVAPSVRDEAVERSLSVIDATCPLVAKVHSEVRRYAAADHTVVLIGHADHEEVVGTVGEAPDRVRVVADEAEAAAVSVADPDKVSYVMQTTLAVDEGQRISNVLRGRFPRLRAPRLDDICYATSNRQQAIRDIAGDVDLVLVVGSPNSSNSQRLVEVSERAGVPSYLVDDATDIELGWLRGVRRVGLTAGASAPPHLVDDIVGVLSGLGTVTVQEHRAVVEDIRFTLPKEVS
jgi:4-hydroxy-3-methylbut-2-en-1-yl diphosphate reductase